MACICYHSFRIFIMRQRNFCYSATSVGECFSYEKYFSTKSMESRLCACAVERYEWTVSCNLNQSLAQPNLPLSLESQFLKNDYFSNPLQASIFPPPPSQATLSIQLYIFAKQGMEFWLHSKYQPSAWRKQQRNNVAMWTVTWTISSQAGCHIIHPNVKTSVILTIAFAC